MLIGGLLRTACVRGPPDVQVMRSEGGERSRRRNGMARNMLRGERCCSCGGWDDCCPRDDDDSDRAEPVLEFAVAGRLLFDAGGASRVVAVCRRRTATGVGEDADESTDDEDVVMLVLVWALVEEVLLLLVLGGAGAGWELEGETVMPKGVSSSFTLEEDATFLVAGCTRD